MVVKPYYEHAGISLHLGDCRAVLAGLPDGCVQTCVTSPPYFGLRSYGTEAQAWGGDSTCDHEWMSEAYYREGGGSGSSSQAFSEPGAANAARLKETRWRDDTRCGKCGAWRGELGGERTPQEFVGDLVAVFREVRRCLRDDGTVWLNLGDSYASDTKWGGSSGGKHVAALHGETGIGRGKTCTGLKGKDLMGIPWRVAFALQDDGWYLRSDIIWHKPNPMPESVTDRPTRSHEYIFLLSKSARYFYDAAAIAEPALSVRETIKMPDGWDTGAGSHGAFHRSGREKGQTRTVGPNSAMRVDRVPESRKTNTGAAEVAPLVRNKRDVWTIATAPYPNAHFATFPAKLIEPCILAGAPVGGVVLDPFAGAGTSLLVAKNLGRAAIGIELNESYCRLIVDRLRQSVLPLGA